MLYQAIKRETFFYFYFVGKETNCNKIKIWTFLYFQLNEILNPLIGVRKHFRVLHLTIKLITNEINK